MNIIEEIELSLPAESTIPNSGVAGIADRISGQLAIWAGKKESDPSMFETLKAYWDNVNFGWNGDPNIPWSAAFVSYVLGGDFPGSAAHRKYVEKVIATDGPWTAHSIPKNADKIQLNPGDVLVKPRSGNRYNSHGAVVYSVQNGVASLVGGNVSNTAKIEDKIAVDSQGRPVESMAPWLIVLKREQKKSLTGSAGFAVPFAVLALGSLYLIARNA
ncbi:MAG: hypothetical protein CMJ32_12505 [Phycisphaerae bacterium]|nr:hypothetical protein [Phycisphaerae bacterium]